MNRNQELKEKILSHPDWKADKTASLIFDDKLQRSDYAVFCRNPMAEFAGYLSTNLNQFYVDTDGKVYTPCVKLVGPTQGINDAVRWAPWEEFANALDAVNTVHKSVRVLNPEFMAILKGERSFRTKAEQKKKLQGAFNKIIAVLGG